MTLLAFYLLACLPASMPACLLAQYFAGVQHQTCARLVHITFISIIVGQPSIKLGFLLD